MNLDTKVSLKIGEEIIEGKIIQSTKGQNGIDLSSIKNINHFVYDPGYSVTASCKSSITYIDGEKGELLYRGHDISEFINKGDFLFTAYVLINGGWSNENDKDFNEKTSKFKQEINNCENLPHNVIDNIKSFSADSKPMMILSSAFSALAACYTKNQKLSYKELTIANAPRIIAYIYRHITNQDFLYPKSGLNYVENFLYMIFGSYNIKHVEILEKILILHADHEQNASTTTARSVLSTGADPILAISAAIGALSGVFHGGANEEAINMLEEINSVNDINQSISNFIKAVKNKEKRLMGFGHRVYKYFDPRARILAGIFEKIPSEHLNKSDLKLFDTAKKLENHALNDEYFQKRNLYPNVDFYSGILEKSIGIPSNMFTLIFALARISGWIAHINEAQNDKEQKLVRPRQIYCGNI
jgi:citrate synthase